MTGRWTYIDPSKYDGAREVDGLKLDAGYAISCYDVPDGVRVRFGGRRSGRGGYLVELRYISYK